MPGRFSEVAERGASSHGAAHDVQQFVGDGLLASFVVHDGEVLYQVVGIVRAICMAMLRVACSDALESKRVV